MVEAKVLVKVLPDLGHSGNFRKIRMHLLSLFWHGCLSEAGNGAGNPTSGFVN